MFSYPVSTTGRTALIFSTSSGFLARASGLGKERLACSWSLWPRTSSSAQDNLQHGCTLGIQRWSVDTLHPNRENKERGRKSRVMMKAASAFPPPRTLDPFFLLSRAKHLWEALFCRLEGTQRGLSHAIAENSIEIKGPGVLGTSCSGGHHRAATFRRASNHAGDPMAQSCLHWLLLSQPSRSPFFGSALTAQHADHDGTPHDPAPEALCASPSP